MTTQGSTPPVRRARDPIRPDDFHRVNLTRIGFTMTYKCAEAV